MAYADFKRCEVIATKFIVRTVGGGGTLGVSFSKTLVEIMRLKPNDYFLPRISREKDKKKLILEHVTKEEEEAKVLREW